MTSLDQFFQRAEALLTRFERMLPAEKTPTNWDGSVAFQWRKHGAHAGSGYLKEIKHPSLIAFEDLHNVDRQKAQILQNTRQFVSGLPANNVLLTGARGTGKSSLIKACLNHFSSQGLRLIEVDKADLVDLIDIVECIADRPERFIIFCDDLSFEEGESSYKALKVALDGGVARAPDNVLIYATSNRRHLMPERISENRATTRGDDGEIHPGEAIEEKVSLSERFGIWLSFYPFNQNEYLAAVAHWMREMGVDWVEIEAAQPAALQWALARGARSGRIAFQFAKDYAGKKGE